MKKIKIKTCCSKTDEKGKNYTNYRRSTIGIIKFYIRLFVIPVPFEIVRPSSCPGVCRFIVVVRVTYDDDDNNNKYGHATVK